MPAGRVDGVNGSTVKNTRRGAMRCRELAMGLVLLAAAVSLAAQTPAPAKPAQTDEGLVSGLTDSDGVTAYLGIPYAAPPIGALRWRPPQAVTPWKGVRMADKFGDSCIQILQGSRLPWTAPFMTQNAISENCLS